MQGLCDGQLKALIKCCFAVSIHAPLSNKGPLLGTFGGKQVGALWCMCCTSRQQKSAFLPLDF